jgi:hypothetical protein
MLDPDDRSHIESRLGRPLTSEDLAQASTFDESLETTQMYLHADLATDRCRACAADRSRSREPGRTHGYPSTCRRRTRSGGTAPG